MGIKELLDFDGLSVKAVYDGNIVVDLDDLVQLAEAAVYLLADPVVDNAIKAEQLLNTMIDFQKEYLGYLK